MKSKKFLSLVVGLLVAVSLNSTTARAESESELRQEIDILKKRLESLENKASNLEDKSEVLATEVGKGQLASFLPEKKEYKKQFGLGPAASGVYRVNQGLSVGGYGEMIASKFAGGDGKPRDFADMYRLITYFGYKFNDNVVFNSEIEFEHGTTDGIGGESGDKAGKVSVEFAYLDFLLDESFNLRAGEVLAPLGFVNEVHEPPYFHGVLRPYLERTIIPSTFRELGVGAFGQVGDFEYRGYIGNGLRATRFSSTGYAGGRQSGNRALIEDLSFTGRVDYTAIPGTTIGVGTWVGNSGQGDSFDGQTPDVFTQLYEAHLQSKIKNFEFKSIVAFSKIDDTQIISTNSTVPEQQFGYYLEAGYNILPHIAPDSLHYLAPFVRHERVDLQDKVWNGMKDESLNQDIYVVGLTYKPVDNVSVKADYMMFDADSGRSQYDRFNFGLGFAY